MPRSVSKCCGFAKKPRTKTAVTIHVTGNQIDKKSLRELFIKKGKI